MALFIFLLLEEVAVSPGTRWVSFDCFGTLVNWRTAFASALTPLAGDRVWDVVRAYHVHERLIERAKPHRGYKDVVAMALVRAAADCGVPLSDEDGQTLVRAWASMRPFGDVEDMLGALRGKGYRLAVLTNCDDDLFEITHRTFATPFELFVTSERVRGYKPAVWHFRAFEQLTGVRRGDWVHVASSWYHDIVPTHELGIRSVWLDREQTGEDASVASAYVRRAADVARFIPGLLEFAAAPGARYAGAQSS
jgi:2-haloacid dehalogenase